MVDLVIEYVLDSRRPGYTYTSPTIGFSDSTLKIIWQNAMPRGQGWRAYIGARSLKCFPIEGDRRVAVCDVVVTDQADEGGRQGIRRAEINVLDSGQFMDFLALRLALLPEAARDQARDRLSWWRWKRILDRAAPKVRKKHGQIVLAAPYRDAADWQVMEAAVLIVATSMPLRLAKGWPQVYPITTLALDYREESRLIALPLEQVRQLNGVKAIEIT